MSSEFPCFSNVTPFVISYKNPNHSKCVCASVLMIVIYDQGSRWVDGWMVEEDDDDGGGDDDDGGGVRWMDGGRL